MFNKGYKAECVHAKNCARPHVLNAAVGHVQGDDYPAYSDYAGFYYNDVGQRVMCEDTEGKLYVPYSRTCPPYRRHRTGAPGQCPLRHVPLDKRPLFGVRLTGTITFKGVRLTLSEKSLESLNTAF